MARRAAPADRARAADVSASRAANRWRRCSIGRPACCAQWDALAPSRRVSALAGTDAHARLGLPPAHRSGRVGDPRAGAGLRVVVSRVFESCRRSMRRCRDSAADDAARLLDGDSKRPRCIRVIDCAGHAGQPDVHGHERRRAPRRWAMTWRSTATCCCARRRARRRGRRWCCCENGAARPRSDRWRARNQRRQGCRRVSRRGLHAATAPGGPPVPWMLSNPIYAGLDEAGADAGVDAGAAVAHSRAHRARPPPSPGRNDTQRASSRAPLRSARAARSPASRRWTGVRARRRARRPASLRRSQIPMSGGLAAFDRVRFRVSAPTPMRAWVQLRAPVGNTERWGRPSTPMPSRASSMCRSRVRADRRDVERAAAARSRRLAAVRGRYAEHAARRRRAA